jgi:hypothetical protein
LIRVLEALEPLRGIVFAVASIWMIAATVIAVRQALDYTSTLRAIGVCVLGWVVQVVVAGIIVSTLLRGPEQVAAPARRGADPRIGAGSVGVVRPSAIAPPVN